MIWFMSLKCFFWSCSASCPRQNGKWVPAKKQWQCSAAGKVTVGLMSYWLCGSSIYWLNGLHSSKDNGNLYLFRTDGTLLAVLMWWTLACWVLSRNGTMCQSLNKYIGSPYCRAEMYTGRVACCPLVSHGEYADGTDRRTNARPLHYAFRLWTRPAWQSFQCRHCRRLVQQSRWSTLARRRRRCTRLSARLVRTAPTRRRTPATAEVTSTPASCAPVPPPGRQAAATPTRSTERTSSDQPSSNDPRSTAELAKVTTDSSLSILLTCETL